MRFSAPLTLPTTVLGLHPAFWTKTHLHPFHLVSLICFDPALTRFSLSNLFTPYILFWHFISITSNLFCSCFLLSQVFAAYTFFIASKVLSLILVHGLLSQPKQPPLFSWHLTASWAHRCSHFPFPSRHFHFALFLVYSHYPVLIYPTKLSCWPLKMFNLFGYQCRLVCQ